MTALQAPTRALTPATFDVLTRAVRAGTPPEMGLLDSAGWSPDSELDFRRIRYAAWPGSGHAGLDYKSLSGTFEPVEINLLARYWIDDQVRVVMYPPLFSSGAPIGAGTGTATGDTDAAALGGGGVTLFEGVLARQRFGVRAVGDRDDEDTALVAVDAPTLDNLDPAHLITGRWVQAPGDAAGTPRLIDGHAVPAVFNAGGRPNMMPTLPMTAHDGGIGFSAQLFTFDGDFRADFWTVRDALTSILVMWLFGHSTASGTAKTRSATVEAQTAAALLDTAGEGVATGARWAGLDAILPEVRVQGLGVYDALHAVCGAAGYQMSVAPPLGRRPWTPPEEEGGEDASVAADRLYQVKLWRRGAGPGGSVRLQPRPANSDGDDDAATELARNNVDGLAGMADAVGVRNHISATGPVLIETTAELKPMWSPDEVTGGTPTARMMQDVPGNTTETYFRNHIQGAANYHTHGHVGREWGIDCDGRFTAAGLGYSTPTAYAHDADGFDWLAHLGIDGEDPLTAERTAAGVTDPIVWTKRPRRPLPLTRRNDYRAYEPYRIEVSEDGGDNWIDLPANAIEAAPDRFAIRLCGVKNLAAVCADTYVSGGTRPATVEASWWGLMVAGDLRFRLTCMIVADHAARHVATRVAGSLYSRAALVQTDAVSYWSSPSSILGGSTWARIDDEGTGYTSAAGASRAQLLQDLAERTRDAAALIRIAISGGTWLMDPAMFQVGDRVAGIEGRNLPLNQTSPKGERRAPSIVGVTLTGSPEDKQGIGIDLSDESMRRGV